MEIAGRSLWEALAKFPDPRSPHGKRFSCQALLGTVLAATLAGCCGPDAIAQWIGLQLPSLWHALGYFRKPPTSGNTFRKLLGRINPLALESLVRDWITQLLGEPPPKDLQPFAIDGKTVCSTIGSHQGTLHLLAMLDHHTRCVLSQQAVDGKTNEAKAAVELLKTVSLAGRVATMDAMFCQRDVCRQVVDSGGDYLVVVKDNQPSLKEAIQAEFRPGLSPL